MSSPRAPGVDLRLSDVCARFLGCCTFVAGLLLFGCGRIGYETLPGMAPSLDEANSVPVNVLPADVPPVCQEAVGMGYGLAVDYFEGAGTGGIDSVDWNQTPAASAVLPTIRQNLFAGGTNQNSSGPMWEGGPSDRFGARFRGSICLRESGRWIFSLAADDNAVLWIDGRQVASDGFSPYGRDVPADFSAGLYSFELRFVEGVGGYYLEALVFAPSQSEALELPPTDLFH